MKKLIPILLAAGVAAPSFAAFYRTNNADTDWSNLALWTTDAEGTIPATSVPGIGNNVEWFFGDAADGTTTIATGDQGNLKIDRLNIKSADFVFSGATVNIGNRVNFGSASGATPATAENRNTVSVLIDNGSDVKTWMAYFASQQYSDLDFRVSGNSSFTITSNTWNHFQGVYTNDSTAHVTIDKGSSFTTATSLTTNGTHGQGARSTAVYDIYGDLTAAAVYTTDSNGTTSTINIYGSANFVSAGTAAASKSNSYWNFIMQDVDAAKMTYYDGGVLGDDTIDAIFTAANFKSGNTADSINYFTFAIDVKNFSVDGDYDEGESYAIALLRLTDSESIYPVSSFSIVNSDQMGSNWILGETPLFWDESTTTLYLNVISQVPEPATYAAIFGALTLAFAAYRRRK